MGYFGETLRGVSWIGGLRVTTRTIAFIKIAILARLLLPEQFGFVGIALLAVSFFEATTETGINVFLIQEKSNLEEYLKTAWVVSIFRGFLVFLFLFLAAPFIVRFFNTEGALGVLRLAAFVPLVRGFINPSIVKFQKELLFHKEFYLRLAIFSLDAVVAIGLALLTGRAESLIWGMIAGAIFEASFSHVLIRPRPRLAFDKSKFVKVLGRGKWVTASGMFNYLFGELDDIVLGRGTGAYALGVYQVAYKVSSLPVTEVADVFTKVTFPVYVKLSEDHERLKRAFLRTLAGVFILTLIFGVFLFALADQIVLILLGNNWLEAVPVIRILAFFGVARGVVIASQPLFFAVKKQEYVTYSTLAGILGLALTIIPMVRLYGMVGAGLSALVGALVAVPVCFIFVFKVLW